MNEIKKVIKEIENAIEYYKTKLAKNKVMDFEGEQNICAELSIQALQEKLEREKMRCENCRYQNGEFCRAVRKTKYNLKTERWAYKTMMEPDGYCHIFEPKQQNGK